MAKASGGTRKLKHGSREYRKRQDEIKSMRENGKYSSVTMGTHGGYLAIEKSKSRHKIEEIEAGKILADNGYKVILKDEMGEVKTPDGYVFNASFEQRTPQGTSIVNCKNALEHAMKKNADIALIFDKHYKYHRNTIEEGVKRFEEHNSYRFKRIIAISDKGKIHLHKHNEK